MAAFFQALKDLVPFGIVGLAIAAILVIVYGRARGKSLIIGSGMVLIAALAIGDKLIPTPSLQKAPKGNEPSAPAPSGTSGGVLWVYTGTVGDWAGEDRASTEGRIPKYKVNNNVLCDENSTYTIAVCWDNRSEGYPRGSIPTDIDPKNPPSQWCTYKSSTVTLAKAPTGKAPPGNVWLCGRSIPHR